MSMANFQYISDCDLHKIHIFTVTSIHSHIRAIYTCLRYFLGGRGGGAHLPPSFSSFSIMAFRACEAEVLGIV